MKNSNSTKTIGFATSEYFSRSWPLYVPNSRTCDRQHHQCTRWRHRPQVFASNNILFPYKDARLLPQRYRGNTARRSFFFLQKQNTSKSRPSPTSKTHGEVTVPKTSSTRLSTGLLAPLIQLRPRNTQQWLLQDPPNTDPGRNVDPYNRGTMTKYPETTRLVHSLQNAHTETEITQERRTNPTPNGKLPAPSQAGLLPSLVSAFCMLRTSYVVK